MLGPGPHAAWDGRRRAGAGPVRRPAARRRRHAPRRQRAHRGQRLGRAAGARPGGPAPHHPGAAGRGLRRPAPARAAGARADHDLAAVPKRAMVGTFHRAGDSAAYSLAEAGRALAGPAARPALRGVEGRAGHRRAGGWGAPTSCCSTASRSSGSPRRWPRPRTGPTIFFMGRHEERKGLAVLLDALPLLPADVTLWVGGTGPQTEALQARHGATPASSGSAGSATTRWRPACGGRTCSAPRRCTASRSASCCSRPWRPGPWWWPRRSTATPTWPPTASTRCSRRPATPRRSAARSCVLGDRQLRERLVAAAESRAQEFSMVRLAEAYVDRYERLAATP